MENVAVLEKRLLGFQAVYGEWIDRSAKHAKLALDAGVEERKVRIAEAQGELLAGVIKAILGVWVPETLHTLPTRTLVS